MRVCKGMKFECNDILNKQCLTLDKHSFGFAKISYGFDFTSNFTEDIYKSCKIKNKKKNAEISPR